LDKDISDKITSLSIVSTILVVYVHSISFYIEEIAYIDWLYLFLKEFISQGIARVAVPLFFLISGFLFFYNFKIEYLLTKLKKRFYTIFIPYFLWAMFPYLLWMLVPTLDLFDYSSFTFNSFVYKTWLSSMPTNYPLWFLKDLIVLILFSFFIYFIVSKIKLFYISLFIIYIYWIFKIDVYFLDSAEPLLFYLLGAYIALQKQSLLYLKVSKDRIKILSLLYITLLLIKFLLIVNGYTISNSYFLFIFNKNLLLFEVVVVWLLLDNYQIKNLFFLSPFLFLIYLSHSSIIEIFSALIIKYIEINTINYIIIYLFTPIVTIAIIYLAGLLMKKIIPNISKFILGGRL
jgi:surface polysaccharide O-acyltransferase-like enzyme